MVSKRLIGPVLIALLLLLAWLPAGSGGVQAASGLISVDVRNADLRDVLSALAVQTGTNIVLLEEPSKVTFSVEKVTPMRALELLLQAEGLSYAKEGNLLIVGSQEKLGASRFTEETLARFDLVYIRTEQFEPLLSELGLQVRTITMDTNPYVIWIQGTPEDLVKVRELLAMVDQLENAPYEAPEKLELAYKEVNSYAVEPPRLVSLLRGAGVPLQQYITIGNRLLIFDRQILDSWDEFQRVFAELDTIEARNSSIFPFKFEHVVARDGASRLTSFGFSGVRTVLYNFPEYSHEMIVICPPELESQVYAALISIDAEPEKIKAPIMSSTGEFAKDELLAKRRLLSEMTSIPLSSMRISDNISGDPENPHHVLWAHETPENIKLLQTLVESFDN